MTRITAKHKAIVALLIAAMIAPMVALFARDLRAVTSKSEKIGGCRVRTLRIWAPWMKDRRPIMFVGGLFVDASEPSATIVKFARWLALGLRRPVVVVSPPYVTRPEQIPDRRLRELLVRWLHDAVAEENPIGVYAHSLGGWIVLRAGDLAGVLWVMATCPAGFSAHRWMEKLAETLGRGEEIPDLSPQRQGLLGRPRSTRLPRGDRVLSMPPGRRVAIGHLLAGPAKNFPQEFGDIIDHLETDEGAAWAQRLAAEVTNELADELERQKTSHPVHVGFADESDPLVPPDAVDKAKQQWEDVFTLPGTPHGIYGKRLLFRIIRGVHADAMARRRRGLLLQLGLLRPRHRRTATRRHPS